MKNAVLWFVAFALIGGNTASSGQEPERYMGAAAVLLKAKDPATNTEEPSVAFRRELGAFRRRARTMNPADAAAEWLKLAKEAIRFQRTGDFRIVPVTFENVMQAVPGPDSWSYIEHSLEKEVASDPSPRLRGILAIFDVLQGKAGDAHDQLALIPPSPAKERADISLAELRRDGKGLSEALLNRASTGGSSIGIGGSSLSVPELRAVMSESECRRVLQELLANTKAELTFDGAWLTRPLAQEVAYNAAERLAYPQWTLACSYEGPDLFPLLVKRFPGKKVGIAYMNPSSFTTYNQAAFTHFVRLIVAGRTQEASSFGLKLGDEINPGLSMMEGSRFLASKGKVIQCLQVLESCISIRPDDTFMMLYWNLAQETNHCHRAAAFLSPLKPKRVDLIHCWLAEGRYAEVLPRLRRQLKPHPDLDMYSYDLPATLVALGELLHRPYLVQEAVDLVCGPADFFEKRSDVDVAVRHDAGPRFESSLITTLAQQRRASGVSSPPAGSDTAAQLVALYDEVGRPQDVLKLLDDFPWWGASDAKYLQGRGTHSFAFLAGRSLIRLGRTEEGTRAIRYAVSTDSRGDDDAWDLLIRTDPNAMAVLDDVIRWMPDKTFPLVWKAVLLLRRKDLTAAREVASRAVQLDPMDGENLGKKTRFRALRTLVPKNAALYTKAAALSARAYTLDQLGLQSEAVKVYKEELIVLPEDYRAELQLTSLLYQLEKTDEADQHQRTALTRLLQSNDPKGIVDFATELPMSKTALELCNSYVKRFPKSANAHVLVGTIYHERGKLTAAMQEFLLAVQIDPQNASAWMNLLELARDTLLEPALQHRIIRNAANFPILSSYSFSGQRVSDFRELWRSIPVPKEDWEDQPVYELRASKKALTQQQRDDTYNNGGYSLGAWTLRPNAIASDPTIFDLSSLVDSLS